jgi:NAD(P)-dependent dehydrogenase (short-subunit alcohol dehydrogenase family)
VNAIKTELAADGVRANSVNPGVIMTEIHKRAGLNEEEYQKVNNDETKRKFRTRNVTTLLVMFCVRESCLTTMFFGCI